MMMGMGFSPAASWNRAAALEHGRVDVNPMVILLVEDNLNVQFLIWKLLKAEGFTVLNADSGESALDMSRDYSGFIDLLLSDVTLPRMDGLELCRNIVAERPETKVLMMSGDFRSEERVCMNGLPSLQKPFTLTDFRNSIARVLGPIPSLQAMMTSIQDLTDTLSSHS